MILGTAVLFTALAVHPLSPDGGCWVRGGGANLASRASPLDSATGQLGGAAVKVCYGRPSVRGRTIMGGLVPYGEPWRLGANEATTLSVSVATKLGDVTLKPGVYSLYVIPSQASWQVVVNATPERWGVPIDAAVKARDVGTLTVPVEKTDAPVEKLTLRFEPAADGGLVLVTEWERTRVRVTLRKVA